MSVLPVLVEPKLKPVAGAAVVVVAAPKPGAVRANESKAHRNNTLYAWLYFALVSKTKH